MYNREEFTYVLKMKILASIMYEHHDWWCNERVQASGNKMQKYCSSPLFTTANSIKNVASDLVSNQHSRKERSIQERKSVILKLRNNKTAGIDNLPVAFLKYVKLSKFELILKTLQTQELPDD